MYNNAYTSVIEPTLNTLERIFKIKKGTLVSIFDNDDSDDWGYLVKMHVLIETFIRYMIRESHDDLVRQLYKRNSIQFSKVLDLCKKHQLLDQNIVEYIKKLSIMRNKLAHDI